MSEPPNHAAPEPVSLVDRFVRWTRNNRVVSLLLILGIVVGGLASFANATRTLVSSVTSVVTTVRGPSAPPGAASIEVQHAADVVGRYYERALNQQVLDYRSPTREEWRDIDAALQQMRIALQARRPPGDVNLANAAIDVTQKLRRSPSPEHWQLEELTSQRNQLTTIFGALGAAAGRPAGRQ